MIKPFLHIIAAAALTFSLPVYAQSPAPQSKHDGPSPRAAVVTDEAAGMIRFVIDGQTIAAFTREGLVVVKDIAHGGTLQDIGVENAKNGLNGKTPNKRK